MSSPSPAGGPLLFGLLAPQTNFVGRDQLLDALAGWLADRTVPLVDRLRLADEDKALLSRLLNRHVKRHGDVRRSLAALGIACSTGPTPTPRRRPTRWSSAK